MHASDDLIEEVVLMYRMGIPRDTIVMETGASYHLIYKWDKEPFYEGSEDWLSDRQVWFIRKHLREGRLSLRQIAADVDATVRQVLAVREGKEYQYTGWSKDWLYSQD